MSHPMSQQQHAASLRQLREEALLPATLNLANSCVGVALLSFPYALKKTGLLLGIFLIFGTAYLTLLSSRFLARSSSATRRRSFQYLVLFTHGAVGKTLVELSIIGLNVGSCVAFFVVIGDITAEFLARNVDPNDISFYKNMILVTLAVFVVLPLALVRDIASFAKCSAFSLVFYGIFALYVLFSYATHAPEPGKEPVVELVRVEGLVEIAPIVAGAFTCQPALFPLMEFLEDDTSKSIEKVAFYAVTLVALLYSSVGIFGYLTFGDKVLGDMLHSFDHSLVTDCFKLCFAFSIVLSFPLAVYPLRSSLETLLFQGNGERKQQQGEFAGGVHIPQSRFTKMTLMILSSCLTTGIMIPHFEKILAFTGSTAGIFITLILPALVYLHVMPKGETDKAKTLLVVGLVISVVGTINVMSTAPADPISQILAEKQLRRPSILYNDPAIQEDYLKQRRLIEEQIRLEEQKLDQQQQQLEKKRDDLEKQREELLHNPQILNLTKLNMTKMDSTLNGSSKLNVSNPLHAKTGKESEILQKIKETQDLQEKLMAHQNELIDKLEDEHLPNAAAAGQSKDDPPAAAAGQPDDKQPVGQSDVDDPLVQSKDKDPVVQSKDKKRIVQSDVKDPLVQSKDKKRIVQSKTIAELKDRQSIGDEKAPAAQKPVARDDSVKPDETKLDVKPDNSLKENVRAEGNINEADVQAQNEPKYPEIKDPDPLLKHSDNIIPPAELQELNSDLNNQQVNVEPVKDSAKEILPERKVDLNGYRKEVLNHQKDDSIFKKRDIENQLSDHLWGRDAAILNK